MCCSERKGKMDNKKKIVKTYNGCEVTITFAGKNDKALDEAKRLIIESYIDRIKNTVDKSSINRAS